MAETLLREAVRWHTRKRGFDRNCTCKYCEAKRDAYWHISTAGIRFFRLHRVEDFVTLGQHSRITNDDIHYAIWRWRKQLRKEWEEKLRKLREEMING